MPRGRKKKILNNEIENKTLPAKSLKNPEISKLLKQIEKKCGKGIVTFASDENIKVKCISTGILTLDELLTREDAQVGLPMGRTIELYGPEGSGKSTIALRVMANAQKEGFACAYLDCENAFDPNWAIKQGVDVDNLFYSRLEEDDEDNKNKKKAMSADKVFDLLKFLVESKGFKVIVLDSVAALVPKKELEGKMGDNTVALIAKQMSMAMRVLTAINKSQGTMMIFINQLRSKIGMFFGNPDITTGGRALGHYASVRMNVRSGEWFPERKRLNAKGREVIVRLDKDKLYAKWGQDERFVLFKDGHIDYWSNLKGKKKK